MSSKIRGVLFLLVFYSLSTFLSGCQSSVSKVPSWVRERVFEYSEVKWAYENGYFYEDPVVIEQDGVKLTVWAILADLALT
ncbi:MAG: hypothetical protein NUK65_10820, partial [Firmicutes bacterium]|nr:hypothetical protein [Bacillota bacterium]